MEFATPWDDLDLDLVPPSRPIPRLKLSPPTSYFSLLPIRNPEQWEEKWSQAKTASDIYAITTECIEHERKIRGYFEELEWTESTSVVVSTTPTDNLASEGAPSVAPTETPEEASPTASGASPSVAAINIAVSPNPITDMSGAMTNNQLARKRQRNEGGFYIPMAKRVRFKETLEFGFGAYAPNFSIPQTELACFNGPNPPVSIVALHHPVYNAVEALHDLVAQAEGIEDSLLTIQSRLDVATTSSSDQPAMSAEQLEEELKQIQTAAGKVVLELDEAAASVHESLGVNSESVAQFKKEDPGALVLLLREEYDEQFEWQMRVYGLFAWWTMAIGDKIRR